MAHFIDRRPDAKTIDNMLASAAMGPETARLNYLLFIAGGNQPVALYGDLHSGPVPKADKCVFDTFELCHVGELVEAVITDNLEPLHEFIIEELLKDRKDCLILDGNALRLADWLLKHVHGYSPTSDPVILYPAFNTEKCAVLQDTVEQQVAPLKLMRAVELYEKSHCEVKLMTVDRNGTVIAFTGNAPSWQATTSPGVVGYPLSGAVRVLYMRPTVRKNIELALATGQIKNAFVREDLRQALERTEQMTKALG